MILPKNSPATVSSANAIKPRPSTANVVTDKKLSAVIVAPMFFLLLFGIIEVGRFIFYYEVLSNATREGARYAIVNGSSSCLGC